MPAVLPIVAFLGLVLVLRQYRELDWRSAFLFAAVGWGLLALGITELLSRLRWLDFWHIAAAWGSVILLLGIILARGSRANLGRPGKLQLHRFGGGEILLLAGGLLIVAAIGVIAWISPPNNFDSMTYHMSRVMHWLQNKSVAFYPTHILRQLHQNPWGEYAVLQFQALAANDRYANLVQWFSMLGALVGVSLIARELNASIRGQFFAALVCVTLPMGILQASTTQTDYVVAFWLVCFVYGSMRLRKDATLFHAILTGAALGLGVLTKATMYVFALPFAAWLALSLIRARSRRKMGLLALVLALAFVINSGHYLRNYDLYGHPLGPRQEGPNLLYANETFSLPALASNLIRNTGLHLGTPFAPVNTAIENAIFRLHDIIGISAEDARTTYWGVRFAVQFSRHEDYTGNLIHLLLFSASILLYLIQRPRDRQTGLYLLAILAGFLLFCFYLKWQLWNSRLQLPLFVLGAAFSGLTLARVRYQKIANLGMALLIVAALPWVFYNFSHPVFGENSIFATGRSKQYFANHLELEAPYIAAAQVLADLHCSDVGLDIGWEDYEYPLWVLLQEKSAAPVHLEHVIVTDISQKLPDEGSLDHFNLCAIFTFNVAPTDRITIGDRLFELEWSAESAAVYRQASTP